MTSLHESVSALFEYSNDATKWQTYDPQLLCHAADVHLKWPICCLDISNRSERLAQSFCKDNNCNAVILTNRIANKTHRAVLVSTGILICSKTSQQHFSVVQADTIKRLDHGDLSEAEAFFLCFHKCYMERQEHQDLRHAEMFAAAMANFTSTHNVSRAELLKRQVRAVSISTQIADSISYVCSLLTQD